MTYIRTTLGWLFETIIKPWHPTLLGIGVMFAFYAFVLQNSNQSLAARPSEENFKKVDVGMREEEVYAILGVGTRLELCAYIDPPNPQVAFSAEWWDTQWRYVVYFDKDRKVTHTAMVAYRCSRYHRPHVTLSAIR
jgi:hypothetical protein